MTLVGAQHGAAWGASLARNGRLCHPRSLVRQTSRISALMKTLMLGLCGLMPVAACSSDGTAFPEPERQSCGPHSEWNGSQCVCTMPEPAPCTVVVGTGPASIPRSCLPKDQNLICTTICRDYCNEPAFNLTLSCLTNLDTTETVQVSCKVTHD